MRALALVVVTLSTTSCVATLKRTHAQNRLLREHYARTPIVTTRAAVNTVWHRLAPTEPIGPAECFSITAPCREPEPFCLRWGDHRGCFALSGDDDALVVSRRDQEEPGAIDRWLYEHLDPANAAVLEATERLASEEVLAQETVPRDANTFWLGAKATAHVPLWAVGLQVQGGYRRWLEHYFLVSVGGGYERTLTSLTSAVTRDALLVTARAEFSVYEPKVVKQLNLPGVSGYFGLTGVIGVTPAPSWTTRAFIGFGNTVVPLSIELGYALTSADRQTFNNLYLAVGLGL